jgi:hypothetical protein
MMVNSKTLSYKSCRDSCSYVALEDGTMVRAAYVGMWSPLLHMAININVVDVDRRRREEPLECFAGITRNVGRGIVSIKVGVAFVVEGVVEEIVVVINTV